MIDGYTNQDTTNQAKIHGTEANLGIRSQKVPSGNMSRVTPGVHLAMIGIMVPIGYMYRVPLGVLQVMIGIRSPVISGIIITNGIIRIVMMTNGTISGVDLAKTYGEVAVEVVNLVRM